MKKSSRYYSEIEIKLIQRYFDKMTISELRVELFKHHDHARSENSIKAKIKALGLVPIQNNFWTTENLKVITDNIDLMTYSQIGKLLGKSDKSIYKAITTHLPHLKSKKKNSSIFNNEDNLNILKENLHLSNYALAKMFHCSYHNIINAKTKYKLATDNKQSFTKNEIDFIIKNYGKISKLDIAKALNRSHGSISSKISNLVGSKNMNYNYSISKWSEVDKQFLIDNYTKYTYKEFSKIMLKNIKSIGYMARKLNLKKENQIPWSQVEIEYMKNNFSYKLTKDIAKALNRSYYSVQTKGNDLGLKKISDGRFKKKNNDIK